MTFECEGTGHPWFKPNMWVYGGMVERENGAIVIAKCQYCDLPDRFIAQHYDHEKPEYKDTK